MDYKLAKITKVGFGYQDRRIMVLNIFVDYEDIGSQNICGLVLDSYDDILKRRVGSAYGCEMIRTLLDTLGVNEVEGARGKYIYVAGEGTGFQFKPHGFKTLKVDGEVKEMVFKDILTMFDNGGI